MNRIYRIWFGNGARLEGSRIGTYFRWRMVPPSPRDLVSDCGLFAGSQKGGIQRVKAQEAQGRATRGTLLIRNVLSCVWRAEPGAEKLRLQAEA